VMARVAMYFLFRPCCAEAAGDQRFTRARPSAAATTSRAVVIASPLAAWLRRVPDYQPQGTLTDLCVGFAEEREAPLVDRRARFLRRARRTSRRYG
jgi:hypothetical protein